MILSCFVRCYFSSAVDKIELIIFRDCSQRSFLQLFFRVRDLGIFKTDLYFILHRLSKIKKLRKAISTSKLELKAAFLSSHFEMDITKSLTSPMWTDRITVLHWSSSLWKQPFFVANRAGEVLEFTSVDECYRVDSRNTCANEGTRSITTETLKASSWRTGPSILWTGDWPLHQIVQEITKINFNVLVGDVFDTASNFVTSPASIKTVINWPQNGPFVWLFYTVPFVLIIHLSLCNYREEAVTIVKTSELEKENVNLFLLSKMKLSLHS